MEELRKRLMDLLDILEYRSTNGHDDRLIVGKNKLNLYLRKFFPDHNDYVIQLNSIIDYPPYTNDYEDSIFKIKSLIKTIIEDIEISKYENTDEILLLKDINITRKEIETDKERIKKDLEEIENLKEKMLSDQQLLISEKEKFDEFKTKLEISTKTLTFEENAIIHKKNAYIWAVLAGMLIICLSILLYMNIDLNDIFLKIGQNIDSGFKNINNKSSNLINATIIYSFTKYIFTRVFLYSILIYSIVFCIKNYNAQMHNYIINTHKSNALRSILSLLDTAKSEDGNDKLLIQATQAIFSHQQTGYYNKECEPSNPNLVTNIVESVAKKI